MAKGSGKQRPSKGARQALAGDKLRAFRHDVSQLKRLGAVSKRQDARKQRPTRYMVAKVGRLQTLLRGEAVLVPRKVLRPDILADYVRTHANEGKRHILIRKEAAEKIKVRLGMPEFERVILDTGKRRVTRKRIPLPIDIENIEDFVSDLRSNPEKWAAKRGGYPPWLFAFSIGGNRSAATYESPELLAEDIENYQDAGSEGFWDGFELFAVDESLPWNADHERKRGKPRRRRRDQRKHGIKLVEDRLRKQRERASMSEAMRATIKERNRVQHLEARQKASAAYKARLKRGSKK